MTGQEAAVKLQEVALNLTGLALPSETPGFVLDLMGYFMQINTTALEDVSSCDDLAAAGASLCNDLVSIGVEALPYLIVAICVAVVMCCCCCTALLCICCVCGCFCFGRRKAPAPATFSKIPVVKGDPVLIMK